MESLGKLFDFRACTGCATRFGLIAALVLLFDSTAAQGTSEFSNLIFEPVLLSIAKANPMDLEGTSNREIRRLSNAIERSLERIEPLRAAGSSEPEFIEQLAMLAVAYQGLEQHEDAIEVLEEAVSLTARNSGRDNLEQIPLLEQMLPSFLALDDIGSIDDIEERIYDLKERSFSPGSREMFYATINLADWNTAAYYRENYGDRRQTLRRQSAVIDRAQRDIRSPSPEDPQTATSNNTLRRILNGDIRPVYNQDIIDTRLRRIDRLYAGYQEAYLEAGNVQLDVLIDIAQRIARLAFATKQEMDYERDNYVFDPNYEGSREQAVRNAPERMDGSYDSGVDALEYRIDVPSLVTGWKPEALAAAFLDLGDWHLAYGKAAAAEDAYGEAYRVLLDAGFTAENIDRGMVTSVPAKIPVFATHLYTRGSVGLSQNASLQFDGFVDLSYAIDALGNPSDIEVLDTSNKEATRIVTLLVQQLESIKFRPTLVGGAIVSPGSVEVRYYYSY